MDSQPSQTFLKKAIIGSTISSAGMRPAYTAPIFQQKKSRLQVGPSKYNSAQSYKASFLQQ